MSNIIRAEDLEGQDLYKAEAQDIDLMIEYWSPEDGEVKRVWFSHFAPNEPFETKEGEIKELDHVYMVEQTPEGDKRRLKNASWKLVKALKDLPSGFPVEIVYKGKKKGSSGFLSDDFLIRPLKV